MHFSYVSLFFLYFNKNRYHYVTLPIKYSSFFNCYRGAFYRQLNRRIF